MHRPPPLRGQPILAGEKVLLIIRRTQREGCARPFREIHRDEVQEEEMVSEVAYQA
jgi:hypothetical protein